MGESENIVRQFTEKFASLLMLWVTLALMLVSIGLMYPPPTAFAQSGLEGSGGAGFADQLFGTAGEGVFPDDDRIKILVIALNAFGLTESAAEQIGLILQKNLANSGHFAVVGSRQANAMFEKDRPDLVDCREIACGVESGKQLGADMVLVGSVSMRNQSFTLNVRIIETVNNTTDYDEQIQFDDESMDEDLFRLANNISRNSLLTGRILSTSIRGVVISLGKRSGIKIGDFMVVYKVEVPINDLQGKQIDTQTKKIAIVKVLNVNENSSEAILVHSVEPPQVGHFARTYTSPTRQITLVEDTRREIDVGLRLENRFRPLELAPVMLADTEKKRWLMQMSEADSSNQFWMIVTLASGAGAFASLQAYGADEESQIQAVAMVGLTAYSAYRYLDTRKRMSDLRLEGRAKGFLTSSLHPSLQVTPDSLAFSLAYRF